MANRLANETSPYLLQHKDNPVDWFPWGEAAFERAKAEDKPVFLSVGYSACHWCHVMESESFVDEETAALMNEHFVNIKVDREERPDVDNIYMQAVQALTGHGGWPMSVWLLPDGRPFYGGTYFPATPHHGMPSFKQVLQRIAEIYEEKRDRIENDASRLTSAISGRLILDNEANQALDADVLKVAFQDLAQRYDSEWGGFGASPKFPPAMTLELLLRLHRRYDWAQPLEMVKRTLDRMHQGGMYDQIGGGFHRYSVDRYWLVPHFEKMLYDNALLIRAYLFGYQVTGEARYRTVVEDTIAYVRREMTDPSGGFYSSQDADSDGEEGKFFTWRESELWEVLGEEINVELVADYWGLLGGPNFEGANILWIPEAAGEVATRNKVSENTLLKEVEAARRKLFEARERRVKPARDEKILTSWNALMINSLAQAGRVLGKSAYVTMAEDAARNILENMRQSDGRLYRTSRDGRAHLSAYLEDYAFFVEALIELYQSTFNAVWFRAASELTELMIFLFWDEESGFYDTSHDHESLITRPQEVTDNAIPSGTSSAVAALARMAALTGNADYSTYVERVLIRLSAAIQQYPQAFSYLASQLEFVTSGPTEIALVSSTENAILDEMLEVLFRSAYRPNQVVAFNLLNSEKQDEAIPLLLDRASINNSPTAYVCQKFTCRQPVVDPQALAQQLDMLQSS